MSGAFKERETSVHRLGEHLLHTRQMAVTWSQVWLRTDGEDSREALEMRVEYEASGHGHRPQSMPEPTNHPAVGLAIEVCRKAKAKQKGWLWTRLRETSPQNEVARLCVFLGPGTGVGVGQIPAHVQLGSHQFFCR